LVGGVDGELRVKLPDDLPLFAEGAGNNVHIGSPRGVMRDSAASCQSFVVRMGMDKEQTGRFLRQHHATRYR
jgi:hypothetical protein